jgi:hypothetical protein
LHTNINAGGPDCATYETSKTGWLQKRGGSGIFQSWKRRWFSIQTSIHNKLFYYEDSKNVDPNHPDKGWVFQI